MVFVGFKQHSFDSLLCQMATLLSHVLLDATACLSSSSSSSRSAQGGVQPEMHGDVGETDSHKYY